MKTLLFFLLLTSDAFGQNYVLMPDTCTHCSYFVSTGGSSFYEGSYETSPEKDTLVAGNSYMKIPFNNAVYNGPDIYAVRQVGNKVFGVALGDTTQEYLIQDWDVEVGDTLYNLFSDKTYYNAVFIAEDSAQLNDGSYHHVRQMKGVGFYPNGQYDPVTWTFYWNERGLCAAHVDPYYANSGGLLFNLPYPQYGSISVLYYLPRAHTADTRYNIASYMTGCTFDGTYNGLNENSIKKISLYPNPTKDILYFEEKVHDITILDMRGNILLKDIKERQEIDISDLKTGFYIILVKTLEGELRQVKICKVQ